MKMFSNIRKSLLMQSACLFLLCVILSGCEAVRSYQAPDHTAPNQAKIAILPFCDSRSYRSKDKEVDAGKITTEAVKEAIAKQGGFAPIVIDPKDKDASVATPAKAAELGRAAQADLVILGENFNFIKGKMLKATKAGLNLTLVDAKSGQVVWYADTERSLKLGGRKPEVLLEKTIVELIKNYRENLALTGNVKSKNTAPKLLVLPFMDAPRPAEEMGTAGGGNMVPNLLALQFQRAGVYQPYWSQDQNFATDKLVTFEQALAAAKKDGADFVMRGRVNKLHRSKQSFSALTSFIHTSVTAVQILAADPGIIDFDVEIYNVKTGEVIWTGDYETQVKFKSRVEEMVRTTAARFAKEIKSAKANDIEKKAPLRPLRRTLDTPTATK